MSEAARTRDPAAREWVAPGKPWAAPCAKCGASIPLGAAFRHAMTGRGYCEPCADRIDAAALGVGAGRLCRKEAA